MYFVPAATARSAVSGLMLPVGGIGCLLGDTADRAATRISHPTCHARRPIFYRNTADIPQADIVVTGSYARGPAQNGAVQADVISAADLVKSGSPTIGPCRTAAVSSGSDGEANNFNSLGHE